MDFARRRASTSAVQRRPRQRKRVENGVGYVRRTSERPELPRFQRRESGLELWLATIANVRIHGETHQRPVDLFRQEQTALRPLNVMLTSAAARGSSAHRASSASNSTATIIRCRPVCRPAGDAQGPIDRVCIYIQDVITPRHGYDRRRISRDPDLPRAHCWPQRHSARSSACCLNLSREAQAYYEGLEQRRVNPRHHLRTKIVALSEIWRGGGGPGVGTASCSPPIAACIANMLEMRSRRPEQAHSISPGARTCSISIWTRPTCHCDEGMAMNPERRTRARPPGGDPLGAHLASLKLSYVAGTSKPWPARAAAEQWPHVDYWRGWSRQAHRREDRSIQRRITVARFPVPKTLDQFDWGWPEHRHFPQIQNLFHLRFIEDKSTSSSSATSAWARPTSASPSAAACLAGYPVLFAVELINSLSAPPRPGNLKRELRKYLQPRLLLVDRLGYLPIDKHGADLLFQVISGRYERRRPVLTTNRAYKHWPEIFNHDATLTSTLLDRVLHHAETVLIRGAKATA
ncbi:MAG: ATP-binding protein [Rhodocyclaceae bacterium]|nr:ATP-binding protein [Rhodocyclaceae bacterium]